MVEVRYIHKKGKKFGPYYYQTYRKNGKVKKSYIGSEEDYAVWKNKNERSTTNWRLALIPAIILVFIFGLFIYLNHNGISGHAILDIQNTYLTGENISGDLKLVLKSGELLPADTKIIVEQTSGTKEFLLSDFFNLTSGEYYAEGFNVSGQGEGVGFAGEKIIYPDVYFTLLLSETSVSETVNNVATINNEPSGSSEPAVEPEVVQENQSQEQKVVENRTQEVAVPVEVDASTETPTETPVESPTESTPVEASTGSSITGAVILNSGDEEVSGVVSVNSSFEYNTDKYAVIKEGSVYSDYENLSSDVLNLKNENNQLTITTDYSYNKEGFGNDYLGNENELKIPLDKLALKAENGALRIRLVYGKDVFAEESKEISVENLTEKIGNETLINKTGNETIKRYNVVINHPVKWQKKISVENLSEISVELPKEAENISIKTGDDIANAEQQAQQEANTIQEDKNSLITGNVVADNSGGGLLSKVWSKLIGSLTGKVVEDIQNIVETNDSKTISVNLDKTTDEVLVEYTTQGPVANETNISGGKQVVISASSELNYTDILAYSELDNKISIENKNEIKIYHIVNGSKEETSFDAYDLDEDGKVDYIEWNVPHLSQQTYEIIYITKAEHLDSDRNFVEDVYDKVKTKDDNWTTIPSGDYLRVTFEKNLTNKNDITIYARSAGNESSSISVSRHDDDNEIAKFENILNEGWHKIYLTNLSDRESHDTFDLRSVGDVEYDYMVDPTYSMCYQESANTTNQKGTDGNCGLNYSGLYVSSGSWTNLGMVYDGDWGTYGYGGTTTLVNLTINYTKPLNALSSSLWNIKTGMTVNNLSINSSCWNYSPTKLVLMVQSKHKSTMPASYQSFWKCYNGTSWLDISPSGSTLEATSFIYEEAMIWNVSVADSDTTYPTFSGYVDNNATLIGSGIGLFNVTLANTNGTVFLSVNNTNITATNLTTNVYNASYNFSSSGTYSYYWGSWGNGTSHLYNVSTTQSYTVNASVVADTTYPQFSNLGFNYTNGSAYVNGIVYTANATITNTNGTAGIEFNNVNYTATNVSSLFTSTLGQLSAGTYNYYWWAYGNGTSHNYNVSATYSYTVSKASSSLGLSATTPINYGTSTDFSSHESGCPSGATCTLNITDGIFGVGAISANYSFVGNTNYTSSSAVYTVTINKANSQTSLTFDKTTPQDYGTAITPTCSLLTGVGTTSLTNGTSGVAETLGAGSWNLNCSYDGNTNYTASSNSSTFVINKNSTYVLGISGTTPITYGTATNVAGSNCPSQLTCLLDKSNVVYGVGTITFNYSTAGNANYSSNSITKDIVINQVPSSVYTYLNNSRANLTINSGTSIWLNGSRISGEGSVYLYNNGTLINSDGNIGNYTLFSNVGIYNITTIYASTQNYSSSYETWWLNVTQASIAISIDFSPQLSQQTSWNIVSLPMFNQSADGNNGDGATNYYINISATGGTADLYVKASGDLMTSGNDVLGLGNETYSNSSSDSSVPSSQKSSLTTNYADNLIGDSLNDGDVIYLKFFLSAPSAQSSGNYNNTLLFKAVPHGQTP